MTIVKPTLISSLTLACVLTLAVAACDSGNPVDEGPLVPNTEGFFVFGTNTVAEDVLDPDARMSLAALDSTQGSGEKNMPGVYGKYMYIGADSEIEFTNHEAGVTTAYGVTDGGSVVSAEELANVPLTAEVIYGTLEEGGPPIQVAEEGLYYTFVNMLDGSVVLMKVEPNIIGDATVGQWET